MFKRKRQPKLKDQIADLKDLVDKLKMQRDSARENAERYSLRSTIAETKLNEFVSSPEFHEFKQFQDATVKMEEKLYEKFEARKKQWKEQSAKFEEELKKEKPQDWSKEKPRQREQYGFTSEETDEGVKFHFSGKDPFRAHKAKQERDRRKYEGAWNDFREYSRQGPQSTYRPTSSPFGTLDLPPNATKTQIKTRYRELAKKWHPDKPGGDEAKFNEITQAYKDCLTMAV